jgi:hypothetical protein
MAPQGTGHRPDCIGMMRCLPIIATLLIFLTEAAPAQMPRVGIIDFYGLRQLQPSDLARALSVQIGDSISGSAEDLRMRLLQVPGVLDADISLVCCEAGRSIMYVGVREQSAPMLDFNPAPAGSESLPPELLAISSRYMRAMIEGVQRGQSGEDDSEGHSLSVYGPARAEQQAMALFAETNEDLLRKVLRNSSDAEHRALAAQAIAYTRNKAAVIPDLVHATRDIDGTVRNNAIRALAVMAMYQQSHPEVALNVPYAPFIDLLNSLEWTDRNKASFALAALTTTRDPVLLGQLRERAMTSLTDMAKWHAPGHAFAAAVILGRIAGLPDEQIFEMIQKNKDALINAALKAS